MLSQLEGEDAVIEIKIARIIIEAGVLQEVSSHWKAGRTIHSQDIYITLLFLKKYLGKFLVPTKADLKSCSSPKSEFPAAAGIYTVRHSITKTLCWTS